MLNNIRIVLVETSHPGNIGSVARAMKVMGITDLVLVNPQCERDGKTKALASGAYDVAYEAREVATLQEAIQDCSLVVGSSARSRTLDWPMLTSRECGEKCAQEAQQSQVAVVFGRERTGLTNEELQLCHYHACIPANPEYSSLNLAMAVQTFSYEIRMASLALEQAQFPEQEQAEYPHHEDLERFYQHLESTLYDVEFLADNRHGQVMTRLRRLFARARPDAQELNILRGFLGKVGKKLG